MFFCIAISEKMRAKFILLHSLCRNFEFEDVIYLLKKYRIFFANREVLDKRSLRHEVIM